MRNKILKIKKVIYESLVHAYNGYLLDRAASLSFATLLGLVPLISIIVLILHQLNIFDLLSPAEMGLKKMSESFENKVIISSVTLALKQFVEQAAELTGISIVGLIISSGLLLRELEMNLRNIFKPKLFSVLNRFELWFLVIILIPLLIGVTISGVSEVFRTILIAFNLPENTFQLINKGVGFGLLTLITALIFYNSGRKVIKFKEALVGGFVAAIGIMLSQFGLEFWVQKMPTYSRIYGAFVFIPVFLLYVEFTWISVLYAACISKSMSDIRNSQWN